MSANTHSLDLEIGSTNYAKVNDNAHLSILGDITIEAWIRLETSDLGNAASIVAKGKFGTANTVSYRFRLVSDKLRFMVSDDGTTNSGNALEFTGNTTLSLATWYHVAVTFDISTEECKMYVDGVDEGVLTKNLGTTLGAAIYDSADPLYVGAIETDSAVAQYFDGLIDEVRIWDVVRTEEEIQEYMNFNLPESSNLKAFWKLNNDYVDASGNGSTLTPMNSPVFSTTVPFANYDEVSGGFLPLLL